jgi:Acetyltransferases
MTEKKYRYTGKLFLEVDINPIKYSENYFFKELEMESIIFYELRKENNIKPYRVIESSDKELEEIKEFFDKNKDNFYLLTNNEELIGSVLIVENYIQSLCINKQYQRKGLGTKLIRYAINQLLINTKYEYVELNILPGNTEAEKFYKKIGFKEVL